MGGKGRINSCFDIFTSQNANTPITDYGAMSLTGVLTASRCYANALCMHRNCVWNTCTYNMAELWHT